MNRVSVQIIRPHCFDPEVTITPIPPDETPQYFNQVPRPPRRRP